MRTATAPGAPSRGDLREGKDSRLPIPCGNGASKIQVKSYRSSPCPSLHRQMQATTTPNKVTTWIPEPQDCRRSIHPRRNEPQDCRLSRRPNEKNYSPTPPYHLKQRDYLRRIEPSNAAETFLRQIDMLYVCHRLRHVAPGCGIQGPSTIRLSSVQRLEEPEMPRRATSTKHARCQTVAVDAESIGHVSYLMAQRTERDLKN